MFSGHSNFDSVIVIIIACVCVVYYRHEEFREINLKFAYIIMCS